MSVTNRTFFSPSSNPARLFSGRWTNVTALQGLKSLLDQNNHILIRHPGTDTALIRPKNYGELDVRVDKNCAAEIDRLIQQAMPSATNQLSGEHLTATLGFEIYVQSLQAAPPVRLAVRSDTLPYLNEVKEFFSKNPLGLKLPWQGETQARAVGSNVFQVYLDIPPHVAAADYLAWSDQFEPDFNAIREASKRPYARMAGDYTAPLKIPIPNFITMRTLAQHLAQRAQCHLLLRQPEKALRDLLLVRDVCRLAEGRPTARPMTLIAAMINCAITGLYVQTIADGMRLHVWREPELAAIEAQLKEVKLPFYYYGAMENERVAACRTLETATAKTWKWTVDGKEDTQTTWQKLHDPIYCLLAFGPRGWIYQNMALIVRIHQNGIVGMDEPTGLILPRRAEAATMEAERLLTFPSPNSMLAALAIPNFSRAVQTVARNQTLANEARIACALERYHFAHHSYPATLDAIVPQFIDELPRDLIGGQPLKYHHDTNDAFTLYSIGWNEVDDQGASALKPDGSIDLTIADWVWLNGKAETQKIQR